MRTKIEQIDPVVIMLDGVAAGGGPLSFSGVDLNDGSRVSVVVARTDDTGICEPPLTHLAAVEKLVLVLSIEKLSAH